MSDAPTLLRDLIDIPERVQTNDFVLKLAEGVSDEAAAATIASYVVTPQLARAFDHALGFVQGAVEGHRSAASYLHGSFGSGKSHFMAVLDLLLAGNRRARAITELADTVNRHDRWLSGKKFLMVPYHMIGARDVESASSAATRSMYAGCIRSRRSPPSTSVSDCSRTRVGCGRSSATPHSSRN